MATDRVPADASGSRETSSHADVIRARALTRVFQTGTGPVTALSGLDLDVPSGSMTAFVGPDGAGKTTFLRMICGLLAPTSGTLHVLGRDVSREAQQIQDRIKIGRAHV